MFKGHPSDSRKETGSSSNAIVVSREWAKLIHFAISMRTHIMGITDTIDDVSKRQFSTMLYHKAEQMESRFKDWVEVRQIDGKDFAFDDYGTVVPRKIEKRYQKIEFDNIAFGRRQLISERFAIVLPMDQKDQRNSLLDPRGMYAEACVRAMKQLYDRIVYAAADATVKTGETFDTLVTASADGVLTVNATSGLTDPKFLEIERNFIDNEVGNDTNEPICLALSGDEHETALGITQLVNGDYSRQYPLDAGRISYIHGMKVVLFGDSARTPLLNVTGGVRKCLAMCKGAILVGISKDISVKFQERNDLHETDQVVIEFDFGAVRKDGKKVQMLTVTDQ